MELNDLKKTWDSDDNDPGLATLLPAMIDLVTQQKYQSRIRKIAHPETIGSIICLAAAVVIGFNFYKLDNLLLQGVGMLSILLLLALPVISFLSVKQLNMAEDTNRPHAEVLKIFATQKIRFCQLQKINITLSYLLLVTVIILLSKFFAGRDLTDNKYFWMLSFTLGYIFLLFFSTFVLRSYKNTLRKAEELLQEL